MCLESVYHPGPRSRPDPTTQLAFLLGQSYKSSSLLGRKSSPCKEVNLFPPVKKNFPAGNKISSLWEEVALPCKEEHLFLFFPCWEKNLFLAGKIIFSSLGKNLLPAVWKVLPFNGENLFSAEEKIFFLPGRLERKKISSCGEENLFFAGKKISSSLGRNLFIARRKISSLLDRKSVPRGEKNTFFYNSM